MGGLPKQFAPVAGYGGSIKPKKPSKKSAKKTDPRRVYSSPQFVPGAGYAKAAKKAQAAKRKKEAKKRREEAERNKRELERKRRKRLKASKHFVKGAGYSSTRP